MIAIRGCCTQPQTPDGCSKPSPMSAHCCNVLVPYFQLQRCRGLIPPTCPCACRAPRPPASPGRSSTCSVKGANGASAEKGAACCSRRASWENSRRVAGHTSQQPAPPKVEARGRVFQCHLGAVGQRRQLRCQRQQRLPRLHKAGHAAHCADAQSVKSKGLAFSNEGEAMR